MSDFDVYHVVANRSAAFVARFKDNLPKGVRPVTEDFVRRLGLSADLARRTAIKGNAEEKAGIINDAIAKTNRIQRGR